MKNLVGGFFKIMGKAFKEIFNTFERGSKEGGKSSMFDFSDRFKNPGQERRMQDLESFKNISQPNNEVIANLAMRESARSARERMRGDALP
jgi:hypothetical protein